MYQDADGQSGGTQSLWKDLRGVQGTNTGQNSGGIKRSFGAPGGDGGRGGKAAAKAPAGKKFVALLSGGKDSLYNTL